MRYISLFSGIEAATVAWEPLGLEPVAFSEIDAFPSEVLAHHFPDVPNLGDITKIDWSNYSGAVDIVVGGSPCQSFSVAGKQEGLSGESGLMFEYIRAVSEIRPRYFVWENVLGALSSEGGAAFGQLLREMDDLGYGLAWRVLDAQFFGVAQRRRRVFLIGCLGDARRAAEILFERESLRWDYPSSRDKRQELAGAAGAGAAPSIDAIAFDTTQITSPQNGNNPQFGDPCHPLCANAHVPSIAFKYHQGGKAGSIGACEYGSTPTLTADHHQPAVMCMATSAANAEHMENCCTTQTARQYKDAPIVSDGMIVRRMMPVECERLQGFPDNHTRIPWRGKPAEECPDGPRYKALGNSMCTNVMRWIGERIEATEEES